MGNTGHNKIIEQKEKEETFFEFPCHFPIKIMAKANDEVVEFILNVLESYIKKSDEISFKVRASKTGSYISITAIFIATGKKQLDNIYNGLTKNKYIYMVL